MVCERITAGARPAGHTQRLLGFLALLAVAGVSAPAPVTGQQIQVSPAPRAPASAGWLGISLTEITDSSHGPALLVTGVRPGSPSAAAGLVEGDRILEVNGAAVGLERLRSMTRRLEPGDPVAFKVRRGDEAFDLTVVAGLRPESGILVAERLQEELATVGGRLAEILHRENAASGNLDVTVEGGILRVVGVPDADGVMRKLRVERLRTLDEPLPEGVQELEVRVQGPVSPLTPFVAGLNRVAGAELRELSPELGAYFQADAGLLVTDVAEGTPAAQAGLRPGDVVVEAAGTPVTTITELRKRLGLPGTEPRLGVIRKGERLEIRLR